MPDFLNSLRQLIYPSDSAEKEPSPDAVPRAAAILLIELAMADEGTSSSERAIIESAMREKFGLDQQQLDALLSEAEAIQNQATSMHDYTHHLRNSLAAPERSELIEWLWRVAYADGHLDRHEEHQIRRLADLIGVPHQEMIRRKHRAAES